MGSTKTPPARKRGTTTATGATLNAMNRNNCAIETVTVLERNHLLAVLSMVRRLVRMAELASVGSNTAAAAA